MDAILSDWLLERLDTDAPEPAYRQLFRLLQQAILSGRLAAGAKLPSSRTLGADLAIARNTVIQVYEQLLVEGYVETQSGSGTYVADTSPDRVDEGSAGAPRRAVRDRHRLSARGKRTIELSGVSKQQWGAFMPGVPDVTEFPLKAWTRLQSRIWRNPKPELMTYAPGGGYRPLRRALADHLRVARSANCQPEQIVITTGIHQSVDLAVRLLCDVGDQVWIEEPCYWGLRGILLSSGLKLTPIPVDGEGINPDAKHLARPPRLIICTPSHQYPLGMVMSLARRRMLLEYARQHNCWIIEDDYDSEFRFGIRPLASLQGLDTNGQVIYLSSFSKTLFPGMRVGYMAVPAPLADLFSLGLAELYREGQLMQQAVLAEFIDEGYLNSHIRRMRGLYAERRSLLIAAVQRRFGDALPVMGDEAGLHLVLGLPHLRDDWAVCRTAMERGIIARPLSAYYSVAKAAQVGLLLGYGCVPNEKIGPAFDTLADVIEEVSKAGRKTRRSVA
ncbi:DNA-binding protein [Rhodoferax koreense]|uniref:DNA-binding protein n=1 Tax=Rhodoferax koreensis TaxID=1842727 RepID=A0A1P8JQK4_9BURK|nr:PLP-dependent aminotransferase family protein [Rhodoferax koreense]APW36011.1 DNA-binding protein [Rhodoferax koreense]